MHSFLSNGGTAVKQWAALSSAHDVVGDRMAE